jgi:hypothetical protein
VRARGRNLQYTPSLPAPLHRSVSLQSRGGAKASASAKRKAQAQAQAQAEGGAVQSNEAVGFSQQEAVGFGLSWWL